MPPVKSGAISPAPAPLVPAAPPGAAVEACKAAAAATRRMEAEAVAQPCKAGQADTREVLRTVINECVAVARAAGVALPDIDWTEKGLKNAETLGEATSSTAQDIARSKPTEIDSLNGYIVRRGKELGVSTPVNMTLFALIKLIEESSAKRSGRAGSAS